RASRLPSALRSLQRSRARDRAPARLAPAPLVTLGTRLGGAGEAGGDRRSCLARSLRRRRRAPARRRSLQLCGLLATNRLGAPLLVSYQVVDAAGSTREEARDDSLCQILHVDELARLAPVAGDRERFAPPGAAHEGRNHGRGPRPRPVRDAKAEDRVPASVQL